MSSHWNEEDDDEIEEGDDEYVEQVCDVVCPHCRRPLQLVLAPAHEEVVEEDDDEED